MNVPWLEIVMTFVFGGPDASMTERVLRGCLIACSLFATVQLMTMLVTRWGDHHVVSKSLGLSILIHCCICLGWATVAETQRNNGQSLAGSETESSPVPITLAADEALPLESSVGGEATFGRTRSDVPPTRSHREHSPIARNDGHAIPLERFVQAAPMEIEQPTLPSIDQSPEAPRPVQIAARLQNSAPAVISETDQDQAPSARADAKPTLRSRQPTAQSAAGFSNEGPRPIESSRQSSQPVPQVPALLPSDATQGSPIASAAPSHVTFKPDTRPRQQAPQRAPQETISIVRGVVTDDDTGQPIEGAIVRFDRVEGKPIQVQTGADGKFELRLPEAPLNVAIAASKTDYLPHARNLRLNGAAGNPHRLDFSLKPPNESVVPLETQPVVHHLGNDQFEGTANSQFQRRSEGPTFASSLVIPEGRLRRGISQTTFTFLAKGVQCSPQVWINGKQATAETDQSPTDGSYGTLVYSLEASWLRTGKNQIEIRAVVCNGDLDDFEFVNMQVRLSRTK